MSEIDLDAAEAEDEGEDGADDEAQEPTAGHHDADGMSTGEAMPTQTASAPSEEAPPPAAAPTKPLVPQRAHPPPLAPVEAFPPWATAAPRRSPRNISGDDAEYVLKGVVEAFNHPSLTHPAKP